METATSIEAFPLCPVTGQPAVRRVQWVTTRLLTDLWRIEFGIDVRASFGGLQRFGLWESPTGLYFFDPPVVGDPQFYSALFNWQKRQRLLPIEAMREEWRIAAARIPSGARVLDVGCGLGGFRNFVPHAEYTGIDPNLSLDAPAGDYRKETLTQHLAERAAFYDAVCCFQVIEHVSDPKSLFGELVQAARPGGLICVGVPHVPSAFTRIPNYLINAPPHHLTWWNETSLAELARGAGASIEGVEKTPWGRGDAVLYWMERCSPLKCGAVHYRGAASWHASALTGFALGILGARLFGPPKETADEGSGLLLIARRPSA